MQAAERTLDLGLAATSATPSAAACAPAPTARTSTRAAAGPPTGAASTGQTSKCTAPAKCPATPWHLLAILKDEVAGRRRHTTIVAGSVRGFDSADETDCAEETTLSLTRQRIVDQMQ
jgi:hypothetical protein